LSNDFPCTLIEQGQVVCVVQGEQSTDEPLLSQKERETKEKLKNWSSDGALNGTRFSFLIALSTANGKFSANFSRRVILN
jgi:hypothetical protein